jgi:hypothetical protein
MNMITLHNYQPIRRRVNWPALILSALAHAAIGVLLAYAVLGMAGAWDEAQACIQCAGGVR